MPEGRNGWSRWFPGRSVASPPPGHERRVRALRIAAQLALLAFSFTAVVGFVSFRRYVEASPRFCQTCHQVAPEIALWMESEHRNVRCQQCHHQTLRDGVRILAAYVSGGSTETHAPVDVHSCAGCHASHDTRWPTIAGSIGHTVHAERAGLACTICHGREMHFERPARATCERCHAGMTVGSAHEPQHCLACHDFLSREEAVRPQRADCLRCHRSQDRPIVIPATAPMQFTCSACHRPHSEQGIVACTDCHPARALAGLHGEAGHADCRACHSPHGWKASKEQCFACHQGLHGHYPDKACSQCHSFEAGLGTGP